MHECSGTYDATLLLSSPRGLSFSFASLLASNTKTPSWALSGATQSGPGFLNVRNLFFVPSGKNRATDEFEFTTRFGSNVPATGNPSFPMVNPSPDAPSSVPNLLAIANAPKPTSKVIVRHCPASTNTTACPNITRETWFVYPDPTPTDDGVGENVSTDALY